MALADILDPNPTLPKPTGTMEADGTNPTDANPGVVDDTTPESSRMRYLWALFGIVVFLIALRYVTNHDKFEEEVHLISPGFYNFMVIGVNSALWIALYKVIIVKYPVKGLSEIAAII